MIRLILVALLGLMPLVAPPARAQVEKPLLVFAAASLQSSLNRIGEAWRQETGKRVVFSFASSAALARQIEQGAPADLFASADAEWMDYLAKKNLIDGASRRDLLGNALVLVAPAGSAATLKIAPGFGLLAALGDSRLATGEVNSVPAGRYAKQALAALNLWPQIEPRIAGADNVRAALLLVARGEARFGIVYASDAAVEPRVRVVDVFPAETHAPIRYPFARLAASRHPDASAFLDYLRGRPAGGVFAADGFTLLEAAP